jgi:hypothetical protein
MLVIISSPYTNYVNQTVDSNVYVPFTGKRLTDVLNDPVVARIVFDAAQYALTMRLNLSAPSNVFMDILNKSVFFYNRVKQRQQELVDPTDVSTPVSRLIDGMIWYLLSIVRSIATDCRQQLNPLGNHTYQISALNNGILIKCL